MTSLRDARKVVHVLRALYQREESSETNPRSGFVHAQERKDPPCCIAQ